MFRQERQEFINRFKHTPRIQEDNFYIEQYKNQKIECQKKYYSEICDKTNMITNIDEFFDSGWFNKYNNAIDTITDYKTIKELLENLKRFKLILKIQSQELDDSIIENDLYECIIKRIQYKYKCIKENDRNIGHDAENLKQIYHYNKLNQLKILFKRILDKKLELKEEIRKKHEEFLKIDLEIDKILSDNSTDSFTPIVKKKKKNSRKKHK